MWSDDGYDQVCKIADYNNKNNIIYIFYSKKMMYLVKRFVVYAKHNYKRSKQKRHVLMNSVIFPYYEI